MTKYVRALEKEMSAVEANDLDAYRTLLVEGSSDTSADAGARHLRSVADEIIADSRYHHASNQKAPRKVGTSLELLDCLTCDKCIPVCPNNANFGLDIPPGETPSGKVRWQGSNREFEDGLGVVVTKRHQIGTIADLCNNCGQCDPWCPEDGGPYLAKANLFLSRAAFEQHPDRHGFWLSRDRQRIEWRSPDGAFYVLERTGDGDRVELPEGSILLSGNEVLESSGHGELDLRVANTMRIYLEAFLKEERPSWLPSIV